MAKKKHSADVLDQLSGDDARAVLQILARDETLAPRIHQVAETYLTGNAPHTPEDIEEIAEALRAELEDLEVEEVWDGAGRTRHGYVDTSEVADQMMQRVLDPYLENLERYQRLHMTREATYLCMGVMQGLYEFEHESASQFKDWATDLPVAYAEIALEKWREGKPPSSAIHAMQNFIEENLLHWGVTLEQLLAQVKARPD